MKNFFLKPVIVLAFLISLSGCSSDDTSETNDPNEVVCPQGYTGTNCTTQLKPSKIKITKIRVVKFPNLNPDGNSWDGLALPGYEKPDIFPALFTDNDQTVLFLGNVLEESFSYGNDTFDHYPSTPIQLTNVSKKLSLVLLDDDGENIDPDLWVVGISSFTMKQVGFQLKEHWELQMTILYLNCLYRMNGKQIT